MFIKMRKKMLFVLAISFIVNNALLSTGTTDTLRVDLRSVDVNAVQNQLQAGSGRILSVIDKTSIEKLPVQSLDDLLKTISGVDIRQRGVGGTQSDISIRGGSFDQVLVLLNGVNITDPQTGHYNLDIPVELTDIQRIELLQGAAARMYGPNAFSGAINIVTNASNRKSLAAELTGGSFGTFTQNISGNFVLKNLSNFVSFSNKSSDGYIPNTDYKMMNAFLHSTLNTSKIGKFDLQLAYQQKSYGANAFYSFKYPSQFDHTQTYFASLSWLLRFDKLEINTQGYARRHYDRFELFRDSIRIKPTWYVGHNYHLTDIAGAKSMAALQTAIGKFQLGVDVRNEHIYSTVLGNATTAPVDNVFDKAHPFTKEDNRLIATANLDYSKRIGKLNAAAGVAVTNNEKFGTFTNGGVDLTYTLNEKINMLVSANTAVRVPTFTDLYYKSATQLANPNLKPEKSTTFETALKYNYQQLSFSSALYYRLGTDIIDWVKLPTATVWESKNLTNVNALGCDVQLDYQFNSTFLKKIKVAYSFLQLDKQADTFDSKYALDYLRNKLVLGVDHSLFNKLSAQWNLSYNERAGDYTDFATNQKVAYKPFTLLDLRLLWAEKKFDVFADGANLFNATYADYGGLTQPGINFRAGVRLKL